VTGPEADNHPGHHKQIPLLAGAVAVVPGIILAVIVVVIVVVVIVIVVERIVPAVVVAAAHEDSGVLIGQRSEQGHEKPEQCFSILSDGDPRSHRTSTAFKPLHQQAF